MYLDSFYFIWTEFETYKLKNISMLNEIMSNFCKINNDINSFRAYLYYIKSIGEPKDIRKVYKLAYNNLKNEEREKIRRNWISWEKIFGTIKTIEKTLNYIENNTKSFNELVDKKVIMKKIYQKILRKGNRKYNNRKMSINKYKKYKSSKR